jgi:phospholipase C
MRNPKPDPGEGYMHTNVQLFGPLGTPYNAPVAGQAPTMQGFVADYYAKLVAGGKDPSYDDCRVIMDAFTSAQLPVLSTLARSFAVFDHWFCAVPSQTYCNRAFFNASTSAGQVENRNWKPVAAPTIFNRLDGLTQSPFDGSGALRWAIYGDGTHSLTSLIHWPAIGKYCGSNVLTMDRFRTDAQNGTLPLYAFIEPRFSRTDATCNSFHPPHDVRLGEALLHDVYMAVRNGKNADRTLLLVTFDEHGGCYDHVPPGAATPPGDGADGQYGFKFDRLGVRVPTIAISSRTPAGMIIGTPMHAGAVARTLCEKYGLPPLTARDASAPSLAKAIDPATMRAPASWPVTTPPSIPAEAAAGDPNAPLDELHEEFVSLAVSVLAGRALDPGDPDFPATVGAAQALLESLPKTCTFSG